MGTVPSVADLASHPTPTTSTCGKSGSTISKGRQQLTWSGGIRGLAELQRTDDLLILDREAWQAVATIQHELLDATGLSGLGV
jgi:hypothetical protein